MEVQNTTTDVSVNRGCRYVCPFNALSENEDVIPNGIQPCMYRVRVGEVFKGNISVSPLLKHAATEEPPNNGHTVSGFHLRRGVQGKLPPPLPQNIAKTERILEQPILLSSIF